MSGAQAQAACSKAHPPGTALHVRVYEQLFDHIDALRRGRGRRVSGRRVSAQCWGRTVVTTAATSSDRAPAPCVVHDVSVGSVSRAPHVAQSQACNPSGSADQPRRERATGPMLAGDNRQASADTLVWKLVSRRTAATWSVTCRRAGA